MPESEYHISTMKENSGRKQPNAKIQVIHWYAVNCVDMLRTALTLVVQRISAQFDSVHDISIQSTAFQWIT